MKLSTLNAPATLDGGCQTLFIYKTKHERLLTLFTFLLRSGGARQCPVVIADAGMISLVDAMLRYSSSRQSVPQFHPVVAEELVHPGEILRAEPFLAAVERELDAAQQRCGIAAQRLVVDMQFVAAQIGSAAELTRVAIGVREITAGRTVDVLLLFFAEALPKYGLQPFLNQFDGVALCETLQRFLCRNDSDTVSPCNGALLQLALHREAVLRHILTIDAAEPRGSTFIPDTAARLLPDLSDPSDDALLLLDPQFRIAFCSRAAAELLGGNRESFSGAQLGDYVRPADVETLRQRLREMHAGEHGEYRISSLSGSALRARVQTVELAAAPIAHLLQLRLAAGAAAEHGRRQY